MEKKGCPFCGDEQFTAVSNAADYGIPVRNVLCVHCGLVYISPQPSEEEIAQYYRSTFIQKRHAIESVESARARALAKGSEKKYSIDFFADGLNSSSKVLEIGCSYGFLLKIIYEKTGAAVQGVEPSEVSGSFAREEFHIPVFTGTVESYLSSKPQEKFSLIILYHVLEHLRDPVSVLKTLKGMLVPGGRIYIAVPDVTHIQEPLESFFQVPHLVTFSPWTLSKVLEAAGFSPVKFQRKLKKPKTGMEILAGKNEDIQSSQISDLLIGKDPKDVLRSVWQTNAVYSFFRTSKRIIALVLPKKVLLKVSLIFRKSIRFLHDRL